MYLVLSAFTYIYITLLAVYEILWKNIVESDRPQIAKWLVRFANWIPNATNTHSEYLILIDFVLQKWLYESTSELGYTYISYLVSITLCFAYS